MNKKLLAIIIGLFTFLLPIQSESKFEIKTGISLSDCQPEFQKRYYNDDLLAGGSNGLGFGAINKDYRQKYYPSAFNPLDFKIHYTLHKLYLLAGIESLGIQGLDASELKSSFTYPAIGFFQGEGNIHSKNRNTNLCFVAGQRFEKIILSGLIMARRFESEYDKNVTLYNTGFLGLVQAESNYKTSNIFAGLSLVKFFDKGKITAEISFRPKNSGQVSSSGKIEQAGIIRFPIDILNGNLSSDLLVGNYLYGDKKPNIYGTRDRKSVV